jgi:hypothetical protein
MALSSPGYDPHAAALGDVSRDADALRGAMKGVATDESVLSKQTAGIKRKGKNIFNLAYGQPANSIIGDEIDGPEPSNSPKKIRQEIGYVDDILLERAERAVKRRALILQEIKTISQLPNAAVQLSNAAVSPSSAELFYAAVQLSNPAIQTNLPFPFVGPRPPQRFNCVGDDYYWNYMGREKFTELLKAVKVLETTKIWQGYLFHGTIGYGKSHLLAALACHQITTGKRVVYIPDCWACAWVPVAYVRAAMLLTWGGPDDNVIRESIMALNTMDAISNFFGRQRNILFLVDQLNSLEKDPNGIDSLSDTVKIETQRFIMKCVANHKYIFGASANNQSKAWVKEKQSSARELFVYKGFTAVSPYT